MRATVTAAAICIASWLGLLIGAGNVGLQRSVSMGPATLLERPLGLAMAAGVAFVVAAGAAFVGRPDPPGAVRLALSVVLGDAVGALVLAPLAVGELTPLNAPVVFVALAALGLQPVAAGLGAIMPRRLRPTRDASP